MTQHRSPAPRRANVLRLGAVALASTGLAACGDDGSTTASTSPAVPATPVPATSPAVPVTPTRPPTTTPTRPTTPARPTTPTTDGGGGMQAGAPSFQSFEVSSPVACQDGNAEATMSYSTLNAVDMEIKIGDGTFEETAGYGPNETSVIASIPCSGAGESSVQMRACTESHDCADSPVRHVTITG